MRLLVKILCFLLVLIPNILLSQNYSSRNFSTADGLSNDAVRSLFIDSNKSLWIGTENGVSLFEGGTFTNLYKEDGLAQNSCWGICEDTAGNMWFASYGGGVTKFDGKNFMIFDTKKGLAHNKTRKVFPYKNKVIVGTEYGISVIDIKSNKISTPKEVFPHFGVFIVMDIFEYKSEIYFSALNEGFFKILDIESSPKVVQVLEFQNSYSVGVFEDIIYNNNKGYIDVFDFSGNRPTATAKFGKSIGWKYAAKNLNEIYVACWGIFDSNGGLYQIQNQEMIDVSAQFGIESKKLLSVVYDDRNDVLYVGSKDKGIYKVQLDKAILYHSFLNQKVIRFRDNLILHENGLDINLGNGAVKKILKENFKNFQSTYTTAKLRKRLSLDREFFELNFDLKSSDIEFYDLVNYQSHYFINTNIGIFEVNKVGDILKYKPIHAYKFGFTADNLFYESHPYGPTKFYSDVYKLEVKYSSASLSNIVETINIGETTYFLSVFNGLSSYNKGKIKSYLKEGVFVEEKLKHCAKDDRGNLIVSSEFGDVFVIKDLMSFKNVLKIPKEDIVGNTISFLQSYKNQILIGTEKGINIYKDGKIQLVDSEQGLLNSTFISSEIIGKTLYVGTYKGYYSLDLNKLTRKKSAVSKISICKILINNVAIAADNYRWFKYPSAELQTTYEQNTISIDFGTNGVPFPQKLKYRYRLDDENQWSPYSDKQNVFLPYLPFGEYDLEIEVLDMDSGNAKVFSVLKINILTPIYYRWWFLTSVIILLIALLYYLFRRYRKKSKEKALIDKRIAETKLEALLSQMNPHFMFNAMNAIQNYVISNDTLNSLHYIGEFAKLMRKTLDNSSKPTISIKEEIEYLETYISIENMRFNNTVDVYIEVGQNVSLQSKIPTMLLQPFVENVFVHAFSKSILDPKLTISFEMISDISLQIKIIDNGKGIDIDFKNLHASKGIKLAKERISLLDTNTQNSIELKDNSPSGTVVVILIHL